MYAEVLGESGGGPHEGTSEHAILEKKLGFSYRSVLGELMYAYVTCRPDIGMLLQPFLSFQHFLLNIITPVYEVSFNISVVQRSGEFDIIVHVVLRNFIPIWNLAISRMNHLLSPTTFRGFHPLIHKPWLHSPMPHTVMIHVNVDLPRDSLYVSLVARSCSDPRHKKWRHSVLPNPNSLLLSPPRKWSCSFDPSLLTYSFRHKLLQWSTKTTKPVLKASMLNIQQTEHVTSTHLSSVFKTGNNETTFCSFIFRVFSIPVTTLLSHVYFLLYAQITDHRDFCICPELTSKMIVLVRCGIQEGHPLIGSMN